MSVVAAAAVFHAALIGAISVGWRHPKLLPAPDLVQVRLIPAPPVALPPPAPAVVQALPDPAPPPKAEVVNAADAPARPPAAPDRWASLEQLQHVAPPPLVMQRPEPRVEIAATMPPPAPKPPVPHRVEAQPIHSGPPVTKPMLAQPAVEKPSATKPAMAKPAVAQATMAEAAGAPTGDAVYSVTFEPDGHIGAVTLVRSSGWSACDQAGETVARSGNFARPTDGGLFSWTFHCALEQ